MKWTQQYKEIEVVFTWCNKNFVFVMSRVKISLMLKLTRLKHITTAKITDLIKY